MANRRRSSVPGGSPRDCLGRAGTCVKSHSRLVPVSGISGRSRQCKRQLGADEAPTRAQSLFTRTAATAAVIPFSDLARAAYCPRQLYYARRADDRNVPGEARARIDLAFRYPTLVDASDATLRRLPIRRSPAAYRRNLSRLRERADYERLTDPEHERVFRSGKDCHGTVHKVFAAGTDSDPPVPPSSHRANRLRTASGSRRRSGPSPSPRRSHGSASVRYRARSSSTRASVPFARSSSRLGRRPPTGGRCGLFTRSTAHRRASTTIGAPPATTGIGAGPGGGRFGRCWGESTRSDEVRRF